ncbi:DegT/DnrJ/EryC1/StrS aminotransferase family protein [Lysinibacillus sp. SGAir0095]|uniref:DegT/DnrJ/EryC1/StrS family aminotransferase n=1 Tax=Lysinibacillus sp. SGAir0095 TaxID=2070463 RepID=UPI0010CD0300|nr:DegT/DnrJ/EryC1/StrS family aminotransferase [Lysinibacillus sp. SGAir0095]QCR31985.1 aminotransferase DegT [Lysinibacillus sp. SGAir0095]
MQFRDLQAQYKLYKTKIDHAIQNVLADAHFIEGKEVKELEEQLAVYVGVKHCITCANGTDALQLALMAWGIQEGDAVFVPDFTYFATSEVVSLCGATPIFVDVCPDTFNMDPVKLELAIRQTIDEGKLKPKVIIPVDLFGLPADYVQIEEIARTYSLYVLEDGAQGFGGMVNKKRACSFGDVATTSFFPAKPLGCYGDGGAIFTDDDQVAELIKSLKNHGKGTDKYDNIRIGLNSRLDTIQAAVLKIKLEAFIQHELEDVSRIYEYYTNKLRVYVEVPIIPDGYTSSFAQYTIKLENQKQRDGLQEYLKQNHIPSMIYYAKPMHQQAAYADFHLEDQDFTVSSELSKRVLSLPMHPYLTENEMEQVSNTIIQYLEKSKLLQ